MFLAKTSAKRRKTKSLGPVPPDVNDKSVGKTTVPTHATLDVILDLFRKVDNEDDTPRRVALQNAILADTQARARLAEEDKRLQARLAKATELSDLIDQWQGPRRLVDGTVQ